jgi:hypothetical protein
MDALGCTVAFLSFRKNLGNLMWVIFYDFLKFFPKFKEKNSYEVSAVNTLTSSDIVIKRTTIA